MFTKNRFYHAFIAVELLFWPCEPRTILFIVNSSNVLSKPDGRLSGAVGFIREYCAWNCKWIRRKNLVPSI